MKRHIIIVAGGSGTRMKSAIPKQFIELGGKPVVMHTIEKFVKAIPTIQIILVLPDALTNDWKALCSKHNFTQKLELINGGETRYHSVKNGLSLVPDASLVGIHDAARPLVSEETILKTFALAEDRGNAAPVIPVSDSLRSVRGKENTAVDRNNYYIVQTPQCFHSDLIKKAFLKAYKPEFTDDATVLEAFGEKINLTEGNIENIKITTAFDLVIAEQLMKAKPVL
ncbi:MAG: 2-C-methyl-D-erythritol 4-phosphate cytidylyltransferase [Bacteroidetes bacterium]|nr:2-C-methyl-D-erythritol 4-phosphate cytidylyltransferase [Bacteroidota bacterium]